MPTLYSKGFSKTEAKRLRELGGTELLCKRCHHKIHGWPLHRKAKNIFKKRVERQFKEEIEILKYAGYDKAIVENCLRGYVSKTQLKKLLKRL